MFSRKQKLIAVSIFVAFFCCLIAVFLILNKQVGLRVSFLDVGQGDSVLIQAPSGQNILIDGGESRKAVFGLSQSLPWWERTIDLVILTHPHADHVGGLIEVLKRYEVKQIIYNGVEDSAPEYLAWLELIKQKNIPLIVMEKKQKINLSNNCYFDFLYPFKRLDASEKNLNNTSLVMKLDCAEKSILFTGDIEKEVEEELLKDKNSLQADILKVAHHGSNTSSGIDFIQAVNPEYAVISVGADNKFGHPEYKTLWTLEKAGIKTLRTDIVKTIQFTFMRQEIKMENGYK